MVLEKLRWAYIDTKLKVASTDILSELKSAIKENPGGVFLRDWAGNSITYQEFGEITSDLAKKLRDTFDSEWKEESAPVIGIMMNNTIDFGITELAVIKSGAIFASLNTQLKGNLLKETLMGCVPSIVIVDESFRETFTSIGATEECLNLPNMCIKLIWIDKGVYTYKGIGLKANDGPLITLKRNSREVVGLLYTSGTTGKYKATKITHHHLIKLGNDATLYCLRLKKGEIFYTCLPAYHLSVQHMLVGVMLARGTLYLSKEFNVNSFWEEVESSNASYFNYMGEMMRYLLNSDKWNTYVPKHKIKMCIGNGMLGAHMEDFRNKFKINKVIEGYTFTEGVLNLANMDLVDGAVGKLERGFQEVGRVVKCDDYGNVVLEKGVPVECAPGEIGLLLGKITRHQIFEGYLNNIEESEGKILKDLYEKNDAWFNTGDLFTLDEDGNLYIEGKIGNNYRWLSHSVSGSSVSEIIGNYEFVRDRYVYGSVLRSYEGRPGVAVIVPEKGFNVDNFSEWINIELPNYAIPRFMYFLSELPLTPTYKISKRNLLSEIEPGMFYWNNSENRYKHLTTDDMDKLEEGSLDI